MQLIHYEKANPNKLFYKTTSAEGIQPFQELSMRPQRSGKIPAQLSTLQLAGGKPHIQKI